MAAAHSDSIVILNTRPEHFDGIVALSGQVYRNSLPWKREQLESHLEVFPEGQWVAVDGASDDRVVGMAASLLVSWDDYHFDHGWRDLTDRGYFTNHDPDVGRTLYGAEIMVEPGLQGRGIGKRFYAARRELVKDLGLLRIRAGARLRGYGAHADEMDPVTYVQKVIAGELGDPTLSFQLKQGFRVLAVTEGYLRKDPASRGWAAVIEWLNPELVRPEDYESADPRFKGAWSQE